MTDNAAPASAWVDGLVDILRARRRTWLAAAVTVVLLGALIALLWPSLLAPGPVVGAVVGLVAVLLATALVIALDSADLVVRGPRHVTAAGGEIAATISRSPADVEALMRLVDQHNVDGGGVRMALTPASRTAGVPGARANMIAEELARRDLRVLCTDLTRGRTPAVGLSDVLSGGRKLADAVRFDDQLYLAHLAIGSEPDVALAGFADWASSLPSDLDVLVAALPPLAEPGVLPAVQGVELVLVLVEVDRTERVDLIASLDAIDAAGVPARLVLVDPELDQQEEHSTTVAVLDHAPDGEGVAVPSEPGGSGPREAAPGEPREPGPGGGPGARGPAAASVDGAVATGGGAAVAGGVATAASDGAAPDHGAASGSDRTDTVADDAVPGDAGDAGRDDVDRAVTENELSTPDTAGRSTDEPATAHPEPGRHEEGDEQVVEDTGGSGGHGESDFDDEDEVTPVALGGGHVRTVRSRPGRGPATADWAASTSRGRASPTGPGEGDAIDETAREAARLTAALQQLATEVWVRDEDDQSDRDTT